MGYHQGVTEAAAKSPRLTERERRIVVALAAAAIPTTGVFEPGGEGTLRRFEVWLDGATSFQMGIVRSLIWSAELGAVASTGRVFEALLPANAASALLGESWTSSRIHARRVLLRAVLTPFEDCPLRRSARLRAGRLQELPRLPSARRRAGAMDAADHGRATGDRQPRPAVRGGRRRDGRGGAALCIRARVENSMGARCSWSKREICIAGRPSPVERRR